MVIVLVCLGIYQVRLITANAYQSPRIQKGKTVVVVLIAVILAVVLAISAIQIWKLPVNVIESTNDYSAIVLVVISMIGLIATFIATVVKNKQNKNDIDE
jgi:uncharacterized membrane protein